MIAAALHPAPRWRAVVSEQIRATGLALRKAGALLLGLIVLLCAGAVRMAAFAHAQHVPVNFAYAPEAALIFVLIAALVPFGVWQDEDPGRRTYHWSMPIARHTHTLTKVFAGWTWTMALSAILLGCIVAVTVVVERVIGDPQPYPASFAPWVWLTPLAAATIAYLLASAAVVGSRRPFIWILGIPTLYFGTLILLVTMRTTGALAFLRRLWSGYLGAGAALGGHIFATTESGAYGAISLHRWLAAVIVWGALAAGLLIVMSRRREES